MAPLSLLGTVVRDKMMKTVTVQVILLSRELRADAPCFFALSVVHDFGFLLNFSKSTFQYFVPVQWQ